MTCSVTHKGSWTYALTPAILSLGPGPKMSKDACPDACGQHRPAAAAFFRDAATRWGWLWAPNILRLRRLQPAAAGTGLPNTPCRGGAWKTGPTDGKKLKDWFPSTPQQAQLGIFRKQTCQKAEIVKYRSLNFFFFFFRSYQWELCLTYLGKKWSNSTAMYFFFLVWGKLLVLSH